MRASVLVAFLLVSSWASSVPAKDEKPVHSLSPYYTKWLEEEVPYIITDFEREIFLRLETDERRDKFIEGFWLARDPTPGTSENEFKTEHYERLRYANKFLGRETSLPGWKTDRGRAYILFGKPRFTEKIQDSQYIHPVELWHYLGDFKYSMPGSFYLLFWQNRGVGPFRLWDPANYSIKDLVKAAGTVINVNYDDLYDKIEQFVDPEIAHAIYNPIPSEYSYPTAGDEPSPLLATMLLSKVYDAANQTPPDTEYAERLLSGKTKVEVEYFFSNTHYPALFYWFMGGDGRTYLDYGFQIGPGELAFGQYEKMVYTNLSVVSAEIKDAEGHVVEALDHRADIRFNQEQAEQLQGRPFEYLGRTPLIPGHYRIDMVILNNVNRQRNLVSGEVSIPDLDSESGPYFGPLLLGRRAEPLDAKAKAQAGSKPFQYGEISIPPLVDNQALADQPLLAAAQLFFPDAAKELGLDQLDLQFTVRDAEGRRRASAGQPLRAYNVEQLPTGGAVTVMQSIPLTGLAPGKYSVEAALQRVGANIAVQKSPPFDIVLNPSGEPWRYIKGIPPSGDPRLDVLLAQQYLRSQQPLRAIALLEEASAARPDLIEPQVTLVKILARNQQPERALQLAEALLVQRPRDLELLWAAGSSALALKHDPDAVRYLERALLENPNAVGILNSLARAYQRMGQLDKAREKLDQSLKLQPEQPDASGLRQSLGG